MKNLIVVTFDDEYFKYFVSFCNSIKKNYPDHPLIHAYYDGADEKILNYLESKENIEYRKYEDFAFTFDVNLGVVPSQKIYFKYFLWSDKFSEFDKVLFLDVDLLVLGSLEDLFHNNDFYLVSDHSIDSHLTIFPPEYEEDPALVAMLEEDQLTYPKGPDSMGNVGVILVSRKYRTKKYLDQLVYLTTRYNRYLQFGEQSAISLWCIRNQIEYSLDFRYNLQVLHFYSDLAKKEGLLEQARIIHFTYYKPDDLPRLIQSMELIKNTYKIYLDYTDP